MELALSENIRSFRKERSLTQEQLSEALGVTPGAVYKWEAGLSVPELPVIVKLADFFDTSVDVLLGYKIRNNSMDAISDRLNTYIRNSDPAALPEAEKALKKYPNSFMVVHGCAQVYNVFGSENHDPVYLRRALELYEQALLLIPQNTGSQVSEYTIYGEIGGIYTLMGEPEKGVEILKKHNTGGMFDESIGGTLALFMNRTEEAVPFLSNALLDCVIRLWGCVIGFGAVFSARKDYASVQEIARWGLEVLSGIRNAGRTGYTDKTAAVLTVLLAHAQLHLLVGFRGKFGEETDVPALAGALAAQDVGLGDALQIILLHHVLVLAADALGQLGTPEAVCLHRTAQLGMEEYGVRGFPVTVTPSAAVGRAAHPSLQGVVVQDGGLLLGGRAAHTPCQVNLYARQRMLGEGHAQDAAVGRGRCLYADAVVGEHGRVVARPCRLALLVIA